MFALAPQTSLLWAPLVNACSTFCSSEWRFKAYLEDYLYTREDMRLDILSCSTLYLVAFSAKWKATQYSMSGKPHRIGTGWNRKSYPSDCRQIKRVDFRLSRFQSRYELHTATPSVSNLLSDMWRCTRYGNRAAITVLNPYSTWFLVPTQEISCTHLFPSILLHDCFTDKILWNPRSLIYPSRDSKKWHSAISLFQKSYTVDEYCFLSIGSYVEGKC